MNVKNLHQSSLLELAEWYKCMSNAVQSLDETTRLELDKILFKGNSQIHSLLNSPSDFKQAIEQCIRSRQPFEWNRHSQRCTREHVKKDWEEHHALIIFSMILEDTMFLKYWGVDYPLNSDKAPGLADSTSGYIKVLEDARKRCTSAIQKKRYDFLIKELKHLK
jgi:hypothetical protein